MDQNSKTATESSADLAPAGPPRSLAVAQRGIQTGRDFANFMSALMSDLIDGRVTPAVGNAACNAGGKLLKVVELQYKYGTTAKGNGQDKVLKLASSDDEEDNRA